MPNTRPVNDSAAVTHFIIETARQQSPVNVFPVGAISESSKGERMAPIAEMREAGIVADIYRHTLDIIARAGSWQALPARDIFDVEYWDLEQAKLRKAGSPPQFTGEIALVTGAASGIGKACVEALLARGAAVAAVDIDANIESMWKRSDILGMRCDVTSRDSITATLDALVKRFGGLDMLILNAGVFPGGSNISALADPAWRKVMEVNLDSNLMLMRECHPLLKLAPRGGRVPVIGSKNSPRRLSA